MASSSYSSLSVKHTTDRQFRPGSYSGGGSSSTSTDTTTITAWDYRAKDNYFSALDNAWLYLTQP